MARSALCLYYSLRRGRSVFLEPIASGAVMKPDASKKPGKILIAIGSSPNSGYLVGWARKTAEAFGWELAAVHVDSGGKPSGDDADRLEANLALCRNAGAEA